MPIKTNDRGFEFVLCREGIQYDATMSRSNLKKVFRPIDESQIGPQEYTIAKHAVELRFARGKQNGATTLVPPFIKSPDYKFYRTIW